MKKNKFKVGDLVRLKESETDTGCLMKGKPYKVYRAGLANDKKNPMIWIIIPENNGEKPKQTLGWFEWRFELVEQNPEYEIY